MDGDRLDELERVLAGFGLRQAEQLAANWGAHGFGPGETAQWLAAGVAADEPHIASVLAAAEWTAHEAGRTVVPGGQRTFVQAVRGHPDGAVYARELRWRAGRSAGALGA